MVRFFSREKEERRTKGGRKERGRLECCSCRRGGVGWGCSLVEADERRERERGKSGKEAKVLLEEGRWLGG